MNCIDKGREQAWIGMGPLLFRADQQTMRKRHKIQPATGNSGQTTLAVRSRYVKVAGVSIYHDRRK